MERKITAIVVDDDAASIKRLCDDLSLLHDIRVLEAFQSPEKAVKQILRLQPDILFLDVEMPEMTGFELLKSIQSELHPRTKVVFYTAYNVYLLEALRASAFDYLLKPYLPGELTAVIDRYRSCSPVSPDKAEIFDRSIDNLIAKGNVIAIHSLTGLMLLPVDDILLFQYFKDDRCWKIMQANDYQTHKLRTTATATEILGLNKSFLQISKDCIVNMQYLASIENKTMRCNFFYPHNHIERTASRRNLKKIRDMVIVL